jgi:hypothetical protein
MTEFGAQRVAGFEIAGHLNQFSSPSPTNILNKS